MQITYYDASLLITLFTTQKDKQDVYFDRIKKGFFEQLRGEIDRQHQHLPEDYLNEHFYQPGCYCIFGPFDLALISLIDSLDICMRSLHTSGAEVGHSVLQFQHKLVTGLMPRIQDRSIQQLAEASFLKKTERLPYIGIASFKLSNPILIGAGIHFSQCILAYIGCLEEKFKAEHHRLEVITYKTFGWNEITLLIFSDSYASITRFILKLRESNFGQMSETILAQDEDQSFQQAIDLIKSDSLFMHWMRKVKAYSAAEKGENTMVETHWSENPELTYIKEELEQFLEDSREQDIKLENAHLFQSSSTLFGFDLELYRLHEKKKKRIENDLIKGKDDAILFTRISSRPGHFMAANEAVNSAGKDASQPGSDDIHILIGNSDMLMPDLVDTENTRWPFEELDRNLSAPDLRKHVTNTYTTAVIKLDKNSIENNWVDKEHLYSGHLLIQYTYNYRSVQRILDEIGVHRMLKERLYRNISNYNEGILDTVLYQYFIEMRPYLDEIEVFIRRYYEEVYRDPEIEETQIRLDYFCQYLDTMIGRFETAYLNRYHQNSNLLEISDTNTKYSGGIQQLLTGVDMAYKLICMALGDYEPELKRAKSMAYITGYSDVSSYRFAICLNPMHVFHPSLFASIVTHEATNHFLEKLRGNIYFQTYNSEGGSDLNNVYICLQPADMKQQQVLSELRKAARQILRKGHEAGDYTEDDVYRQNLMRKDISSSLFQYLLSDLITYYFGYNQNPELFDFWHWNYFLQTPDSYSSKTRVDDELFRNFLLRMQLVHRVIGSDLQAGQVFVPQKNIQILWDTWFVEIKHLVDIMMKVPGIEALCEDLHCLAQSVIFNAFHSDAESKNLVDQVRQEIEETPGGFSAVFEDTDSFLREQLESLREKIEASGEIVGNQLKEGEMIPYPLNVELESKIMHVQTIFYGYLSHFYTSDTEKDTILQPVELNSTASATDSRIPDYVFDTGGGIMGSSPQARQQMFTCNAAFINSLWDMGVKEKVNLFKSYEVWD